MLIAVQRKVTSYLAFKDYMKQVAADPLLNCKANVLLEYSITNIDVDKNTVLDIQISLNNVRPFASVIEDIPVQDRTILTGKRI